LVVILKNPFFVVKHHDWLRNNLLLTIVTFYILRFTYCHILLYNLFSKKFLGNLTASDERGLTSRVSFDPRTLGL
jgi:hypothetical protein